MEAMQKTCRYAALIGATLAAGTWMSTAVSDSGSVDEMNKYVGTWDITAVIRPTADAEAMEIKGVAEKELVGERWIVSKFEADFYGVPFKGQDIYGYDANADTWSAVWVDSFSDQAVRHTGQEESDGQLVMVGENRNPATGETVAEKRTDHWISKDEFDTNFVTVLSDGTEFQSLSIQHKRRQ